MVKFSGANTTRPRPSSAGVPHDYQRRWTAKGALKYQPVVFDGIQARSIARGLAQIATTADYVVYTCSILPEHVRMVIRRNRYAVEQVVRLLKSAASNELLSIRNAIR